MERNYKIVSINDHSRVVLKKRYIASIASLAAAGFATVITLCSGDPVATKDMTDQMPVLGTETVTEAETSMIPVADMEYLPETATWIYTPSLTAKDVSEYEYLASEIGEETAVVETVAETEAFTETVTEEVTEAVTETETETSATTTVTETETETEAETTVTEVETEAETVTETETEIVTEAPEETAPEETEELFVEIVEDDASSGVDPESIERVSRFDVPDWLRLDENGIPTEYVTSHHGKSCAYTAEPGSLMSTGGTVFQGYVAVNPKLIPYGSELYIVADDGSVYGYAIAADTGYSVRVGDIVVDLFMDEYDDCINWGAKQVTIYVLK